MSAKGIHHVTAIAGAAPANHRFYTGVLGLRFVKRTVNFDDPGTYHFYFGDAAGSPGSILTFFPWANAAPGRFGSGETRETAFRVPPEALGYWADRLAGAGVAVDGDIVERFGARVLRFTDPHGTRLALVAAAGAEGEPAWTDGAVPAEQAIRGLHGVTLALSDPARTGAILSEVLGMPETGRADGLVRHEATGSGIGTVVDLVAVPGLPTGRLGAGTVHHVAFRAADDADQEAMVRRLAEQFRIRTTEQKDRNYFRSVYFREPGGVLFEIATDGPGFAVDEPADRLGEALKLPAGLESRRTEIERMLPRLD